MPTPLPPPAIGRLGALVRVAVVVVGATLGALEGWVWPFESLYGAEAWSGGTFALEGWRRDRRDGTVSGRVVIESERGIGTVLESRLQLMLMDEVTEDFEPVRVAAEPRVSPDGTRCEWVVRRFPEPAGKRYRGVALDGSRRLADGRVVGLGGTLAAGGPSWDENVRRSRACARLVARGEVGVTEAISRLSHRDQAERGGAAHALAELRLHAVEAVPALRARLEVERYTSVRSDLVYALGRFGSDSAPAVPDLLRLLRSPDTRYVVRLALLRALGDIGPPAAESVPDLVALLAGEEGVFRLIAIRSLGRLGPAAAIARPELERIRGTVQDGNTQAAVRETLASLAD
jgi:hypothetical protein